MTDAAAIVASHGQLQFLDCSISIILRNLVLRVTIFTVGSLGTEAFHVVLASDLLHVLVSALRAVFAETTDVPRAFLLVLLGIDVSVHAFWIRAFSVLSVEVA